MALMDRGNTEFKTSVTRSGLHYKSSRLERLLKALVDVQNNPTNAEKLKYVHKRLWRWRQETPKEFAARGTKFDALLAEITAKARTLRTTLAVPGKTETEGGDAVAFVARVKPQLDVFKTYGCGDAYMNSPFDKATNTYNYGRGFATCIKTSERANVEARFNDMKKRPGAGATSAADAMLSPSGTWPAINYRMTYERVTTERAGICTTFGKAAAHILTNGQTTGPSVEVVAYKNHVYLLVNRQGEYTDEGAIPDDWTAEPGIIVIDPWAASLGWPCIFLGFGAYPLKSMVKGLTLVAAWPAVEDG